MSKLIILRGPSGSGKSTTARKLFERANKPTFLLEQDHYRFIFNPAGHEINNRSIKKIIKSNILIALEDGYDVIAEGIFTMKAYKIIFTEIFKHHRAENYMFFFDISFEETLERHSTKPDKDQFGEKDMREWYIPSDYLGYDFETIVPEENSQQQTIKLIKSITKI